MYSSLEEFYVSHADYIHTLREQDVGKKVIKIKYTSKNDTSYTTEVYTIQSFTGNIVTIRETNNDVFILGKNTDMDNDNDKEYLDNWINIEFVKDLSYLMELLWEQKTSKNTYNRQTNTNRFQNTIFISQ